MAQSLKSLLPGQKFTGFVAVKKCAVCEAKNNTTYLDLTVSDGQTDLPAKKWEHEGTPPKANTVIFIEATTREYQGKIELTIQSWRNAEPNEVEPGQFIPVCPLNYRDLWYELLEFIESVNDKNYKSLLTELLIIGYDKEFIKSPAATGIHHAYIHGLLEHSIGVAEKALAITDDTTEKDLLITGALLHDIGKINKYDWSGCSIQRTDVGKLLGHIVLGCIMVEKAAREIEMPDDKLTKLLHLIASHHGRKEWGSPVEPMTKEAMILHQADMLDYQMHVIDKARNEAAEDAEWTGKVNGIGREFYIG